MKSSSYILFLCLGEKKTFSQTWSTFSWLVLNQNPSTPTPTFFLYIPNFPLRLSSPSLPGQSAWCANVRPKLAQPASWRQRRSAACTRSSCWAATWQSSPQTQRRAPGTRWWWHTPSHSCPEWTILCDFPLPGWHEDSPLSLRLPGSPTPRPNLQTAAGGAAPCLAVGGLKTASYPEREGRDKLRGFLNLSPLKCIILSPQPFHICC